MKIRPATPGDVALMVQWRAERATWLARLGTDQWDESAGLTIDQFAHRVRQSVDAGTTWMVDDQGETVGTIAVDDQADSGLWEPGELDEALVVHRMMTPMRAAGRGIGRFMLEEAEQIARSRGRTRLVLDAWGTNPALCDYYARQGFRFLREAVNTSVPHYRPMALFERAVPAGQVAS